MTETRHSALAADWATILQSEAAALAVDREVQEALQRAAERLARQALALRPAAATATASDDPARPAGADAPPGTPPAFDVHGVRAPVAAGLVSVARGAGPAGLG